MLCAVSIDMAFDDVPTSFYNRQINSSLLFLPQLQGPGIDDAATHTESMSSSHII